MKISVARWKSAAAFTLVEVALALGLASFCLVTVVALVPIGSTSSQMASDQTTVGSIITYVLADLRATPPTSPPGAVATSSEFKVEIPANPVGTATTPPVVRYFGSSGQQFTLSPAATSRYRLTLNFLPPAEVPAGAAVNRAATRVSLVVSWPPSVDPSNPKTGTPTGRVQMFAALDRN